MSSLGALATTLAWCASSGRQPAGLPPCSSPRVQMGVLRSLAFHLPPHQAKSRAAVETKGQPWQEPVAGSRGANRRRNCQCAPPEGGLSLETSSAALWADRPFWEISDSFSSTLPRRREDRPEHPVRALSVPWQQIWPGAPRQGAKLPVYLRVRVPASKY